MEKFETIFHRAANRHGGEDALREKVANRYVGSNVEIEAGPKSDDRWLAEFSKRIFQAGFNWSVVENKWEGFEAAFWSFNPRRCAEIDMEDMERLTTDTAIVRNPVKIKTVAPNARMIIEMSNKAGSADAFIRGWASEDYVGLLSYLQKHGSHLGANTASYALRFSGVPSFILSNDVTAALIHAGIIDKPATGKRAKQAVQEAFNHWTAECGEDLTYVSRVLAHSIDAG
ncbi:DNA-3-methyladenine glycosylase I [Hellea balneolensis]|uniref:DNA-3-methyladenine glycosylase I n=1 Tax=Hellea balneolensis TaxID=287478 RepID=UPI000425F88D|nr:DNA-3-methyladenine glycosylase I [Hellea balneolensis]